MMRIANLPALRGDLEKLERAIAELKAQDTLQGHRIKVVRPSGTAGAPSQRDGYYPRLIGPGGGSRAISAGEVPEYAAKIERGRELSRLQKQRAALVERIDRAVVAQSALARA
jgi:hypothetical protein